MEPTKIMSFVVKSMVGFVRISPADLGLVSEERGVAAPW